MRVGWLVLSIAASGGCSRVDLPGVVDAGPRYRDATDAGSSADADAESSSTARRPLPGDRASTSVSPHGSHHADGKVSCRAIDVAGDVRLDSESLATTDGGVVATGRNAGVQGVSAGDALPAGAIVSVASSARVTIKDGRTGREVTLEGPARARMCVGDDNEVWMAKGTFVAQAGAGEAMGNEIVVATPLGVVRYNAANFRLSTTPSLQLVLNSGTALLWTPRGARVRTKSGATNDAGRPAATAPAPTPTSAWTRIDAGTSVTVDPVGSITGLDAVVSECKALAADTQRKVTMLNTLDAGDLPEHAVAHVEARQRAHAACSTAHASLLENDPMGRKRVTSSELSAADALWTSLGEAR